MRKYIFVISSLGGGAGRVVSVLADAFADKGMMVEIVLSEQKKEYADKKLSEKVSITDFDSIECITKRTDAICIKFLDIVSKIMRKTKHLFCKKESETASVLRFYSENFFYIKSLKKYLKDNKDAVVIAFLNKPIFLTLLARNRNNKVIISERNDPSKFVGNKTTMAFIHKKYHKSDWMVFQSPDAQKWYEENSSVQGSVVFNPIKPDLPDRYIGERKKRVVNFCRISSQKNLELLIDAYTLFEKDYPEYELFIYGDESGNGAEGYLDKIKKKVTTLPIYNKIHVFPAVADIHNEISDYAMFVSSSDFEGMSNSMIEAMAIGLPTICTDCPAGGARAVIKDHINGILVSVGDIDSMYKAMKEVAENEALSTRLSENSVKIKEELAVDKIVNQWMNLV